MRLQQRVIAAIAIAIAAVLVSPMIGSENVAENLDVETVSTAESIPAEPIPTAEPIPAEPVVVDAEPVLAPKPGPAMKTVPTAEPVPAEPIPAEPIPAEPIPAEPIPVAEPVSDAEPAPDSKMVPVAEPIGNVDKVPAAEPTSTTEAVSVGSLEPRVEMTPIAEIGGSVESILATELDPDAETNPYTEEILALGPPWIAPEEDTITLREMFLRSHREQLEIYDLNHDNQISEEEWKAANEDDLARGEKFFVVDKNEDGVIDESEAVGFLMERVSLSSTYIDATSEDGADITRGDIKEHAPSELRITLFSIPLGD